MREERASENDQKKHKKGTYIFKGASSDDKKKNKIQKSGPKERLAKAWKLYTQQHLIMFCNDVYMKLIRL